MQGAAQHAMCRTRQGLSAVHYNSFHGVWSLCAKILELLLGCCSLHGGAAAVPGTASVAGHAVAAVWQLGLHPSHVCPVTLTSVTERAVMQKKKRSFRPWYSYVSRITCSSSSSTTPRTPGSSDGSGVGGVKEAR